MYLLKYLTKNHTYYSGNHLIHECHSIINKKKTLLSKYDLL